MSDVQSDPCDGWPRSTPYGLGHVVIPADRAEPATMEDFEPRTATGRLATFLPYIRTDWAHWSRDTDWTLESGPDAAPSSIDIVVPYSYSPGTCDSWTSYGGQPGDPPEVETGTPWFTNEDGARCEVNLLPAEQERVEMWIYENPPDDDYYDEDY